MTTLAPPMARGRVTSTRMLRRNLWVVGVYVVLLLMLLLEKLIHPSLDSFAMTNLVIGATPLAFAAMAQASVVLVGGIDLSIGSMMSLVNVVAATWMQNAGFTQSLGIALGIMLGTAVLGGLTGLVITISRVPDIIVTLATSFIWAGLALQIMNVPGGGVPLEFGNLILGDLWTVVPEGLVVLIVALIAIWVPFYRSRPGLAIYAMGSDRTAAFLSGVNVSRTRVIAYALGGVFSALAGLALTAAASSGDPSSGVSYTLNSVAAVVFGGVSLAGGRGGMLGPVAAAFILTIIGTILGFLNVNQNYSAVIQGAIVVLVVMFAGLLTLRRRT